MVDQAKANNSAPAPCPYCGKPIENVQRLGRPRKYCSRRCSERARNGTDPAFVFVPLPKGVLCALCGASFDPSHRDQRHCSRSCGQRTRYGALKS